MTSNSPRSTRLEFFKHGLKCKIGANKGKTGGAERGEISLYSSKSSRRCAFAYANGGYKSMLTCTYHVGFPDYKTSKKHLHAVLVRLTQHKIGYLWVVEFQGRGYPHYHIWLDKELDGDQWRDYMQTWLNVTKEFNGDDKAVKCHMHPRCYTPWDVKFDLNYAAKYANKHRQKWLPIGVKSIGRWWGTSRDTIKPEIVFYAKTDCDTPQNACLAKNITRFRRNMKRCNFAWSKRKKKTLFDSKTNSGFTYIFNDERMKCAKRLFEDAARCYEEESGDTINVYIRGNEENGGAAGVLDVTGNAGASSAPGATTLLIR